MRWRRTPRQAARPATGEPDRVPRICREVQATLPAYAEGRLGGLRRRAVRQHLKRCVSCRSALELREQMQTTFSPAGADEPPPELLDALLARAQQPRLRERAAVPVRGAVSGARPVLSAILLTGAAVAGTGIGWAGWQVARRVAAAVRR